uniref:Uncharacterized protein n=1 Tax=Chromera velia CCMP2878 TaxID=1169474 RepID=A0A0G4I2M5_9ALVE|eukprot:Cvel_10446.t1-p1 / transcript=Cvel_10446.t1 / gene=Cvel_10446 / organism=Chromera_velia_CCMP2878 / gene_product=hypothetical protein / transcript_product=hypothetical protein / location=Cvel_scaffold629:31201-36066(-) / protein_length=440 / sequence_SO=supercontig / SO=protein_coding / is_pseudo=false
MCLFLVGFICGFFPRKKPLINRAFSQQLSSLALKVFLPCLSFASISSRLRIEDFGRLWPLLMWSALQTLISFSIGSALLAMTGPFIPEGRQAAASKKKGRGGGAVSDLSSGQTGASAAAMGGLLALMPIALTWQNQANFPLVVMEAMCEQHKSSDCLADAVMMIFMHSFPWALGFWGIAYPFYQSKDTSRGREGTSTSERMKKLVMDVANPAIIATLAGLAVGLISPLRVALYESDNLIMSCIGNTMKLVGTPTISVNTLLLAASFAHMLDEFLLSKKEKEADKDTEGGGKALLPSESGSGSAGAGGGPIQGYGAVGQQQGQAVASESSSQSGGKPSAGLIVTACLSKLVLVPLAGMCLMMAVMRYLGDDSALLPKNSLLRFIILLEFSSPTALSSVLILQQIGLPDYAQQLSLICLFQHCVCFFTGTLWCFAGAAVFDF